MVVMKWKVFKETKVILQKKGLLGLTPSRSQPQVASP